MESLLAFPQVLLAFVTIILLGFLNLYKNKKDARYPPGPRSVQFLGNILQIRSDPLSVFQKWFEEYGPIYSIRIGAQNVIMLNDPNLVKELFSDVNSAGRTVNPITNDIGDKTGVFHSQGSVWKSQRRFTHKKLRDIGVFKDLIGELLSEESTRLINFFDKRIGQPISSTKLFNGPVVNSLWKLIAGERTDWGSPAKPKIIQYSNDMVERINRTAVSGLYFAPFLRFIAPEYFGCTDFLIASKKFHSLIKEAIKNHAEKLDSGLDNHHDFIDHYLAEMKNTKDPNSSFYQQNGYINLESVVGDLFTAGSETSANTLSFAILYIIQNEDAQRKSQLEIDQRVNSSRPITLPDKKVLPYTEAIVLETLRLSSVAPLGAPHRMTADTSFHGYFLPKDATVISNFWVIHHDPKVWGEDVNEFRPERFLNEDELKMIRHHGIKTKVPWRKFGNGYNLPLYCTYSAKAFVVVLYCLINEQKVLNIVPEPKLFTDNKMTIVK